MPAFMPSVGTWLAQASIWPTATLIVSCAPAGAAKPDATTERTAQKPRKDFDMLAFIPPVLLPDDTGSPRCNILRSPPRKRESSAESELDPRFRGGERRDC